MTRTIGSGVGVALVLVTTVAGRTHAQTQGPVIERVRVDLAGETVTIAGQRFGADPAVRLADVDVAVVAASDTQIVVHVDAGVLRQPGTSRLTVVDRSTGDGEVFVVTLGAAATIAALPGAAQATDAAAGGRGEAAGTTAVGAAGTTTAAVTESATGTTAVGY